VEVPCNIEKKNCNLLKKWRSVSCFLSKVFSLSKEQKRMCPCFIFLVVLSSVCEQKIYSLIK
jgi:hypothetical protein